MNTTIHGVDVQDFPRGTAFQAELVDGTIFTGTWDGTAEQGRFPRFRHVDTGKTRALSEDSARWFAPLADIN